MAAKPKSKNAKRVTYRQEGGDDGYQYVVRIDGREKVNGLTRSEASYYCNKFIRELDAAEAKKA